MMVQIRLSGIQKESIVDGLGIRYVIFTQGCSHHCKGCHNPQTHDLNGGFLQSTESILSDIKKNPLLDGITISGGEPFLQANSCLEVARKCHQMNLNVWVYTGYLLEELWENPQYIPFLQEIDVLVDGRFEEIKKTSLIPFCGSSNQRIIDVPSSLTHHEIILFNQ